MGSSATRRAEAPSTPCLRSGAEPLRKLGADPLGEKPADQLDKKRLDKLLIDGDPEAGGIIHSAVEEFAQALTFVIKRFLRVASWRDTQAVVIGGGFRASRAGELAARGARRCCSRPTSIR